MTFISAMAGLIFLTMALIQPCKTISRAQIEDMDSESIYFADTVGHYVGYYEAPMLDWLAVGNTLIVIRPELKSALDLRTGKLHRIN